MLNEGRQKHPCKTCSHYGNGYGAEPCRSCPLPGQYADALENKQYPTMDFLRQSKPDHWGTKKDKEKREMVEKSYCKYCEQCKETKLAKDYFDRVAKSPDGFRIICAKCDRENKEKEGQEETMAIEEAAGTPVNEEAVNIRGVNKDIEAEIKENVKEGAVVVTGEVKSLTIEEIDKALSAGAEAGIVDLKKYCEYAGTTVKKVTSDLKTPAIANARKLIARAMEADGVDRKTIASKLKIAMTTLWNYLQDEKPEVDEPEPENGKLMIEIDFSEDPSIYATIYEIADEKLRTPENQLLWWLRNTVFDKLNEGLAGE